MLEFRVIHPSELSSDEIEAWSAMQSATPVFSSPLMGPHFARAVGTMRDDARVAVIHRGGGPIGFFPHHRRPSGFARPIGAPLSDYHGVVTAADERLDGEAILSGARLSAFRFTALIDPFGVFGSDVEASAQGYRVILLEGEDGYAEKLTTASRNRHRNFRRYSHKLAREIGPLRLLAHRQSAFFEELLDWKTAQIRRTGVQDFLAAEWTRGLLRKLLIGEPPLEGLVLSLFAGGRQVAAHFGVKSSGHFHPWIGASSPDLEAYSPGSVHQWMAIQAMRTLKLRTYDLGPGFGHWKGFFANDSVTVSEGLASTRGASGRSARSRENLWLLPGLATNPLAARLRRRLDQIAQTELTLPGRVAGLLGAVAALERRSASRKPNLEERISHVLGEESRP